MRNRNVTAPLILLFCMSLLCSFACGCSGLQVGSAMSNYIATGAAAAQAGQDSTKPAAALSANAAVFDCIHVSVTVNGFAYLFGGKTVWANAAIYAALQQQCAIADEIDTRAAAGKLTAADMTLSLQIEYQYAADILLQKSGTAATAQLVSVAKIKAKTTQPLSKATSQPASTDLQNLIASLPVALQPWAVQYGPALLRLGVTEADAEIALLIAGDTDTPYRAALSAMTEEELMAEAGNVLTATVAATNTNAANVTLERQAATGALTLGLSILLNFIGL